MKTYVGLWDRFFGKRGRFELPDGSFRSATVKWVKKMERLGKMKKVEGEIIKVHVIDLVADLPSLLAILDPSIEAKSHYRIEFWKLGVDISEETVKKFRDPATGELFALMTTGKKDSTPEVHVLKKELWDDAKRRIDEN